MTDSILNSTKKLVGIAPEYEVFDVDILMHINAVLSDLTQMGIGPEFGFEISDSTPVWNDFLGGDPRLNGVPALVAMKVRLAFDPPATSFAIEALKNLIAEREWRISVQRESTEWIPPVVIIDGGNALEV